MTNYTSHLLSNYSRKQKLHYKVQQCNDDSKVYKLERKGTLLNEKNDSNCSGNQQIINDEVFVATETS